MQSFISFKYLDGLRYLIPGLRMILMMNTITFIPIEHSPNPCNPYKNTILSLQLTTTATAPQATKADSSGSCRHGYHPRTYCMFAMEYAPFGDLTSMVGEPASGIIVRSKNLYKNQTLL